MPATSDKALVIVSLRYLLLSLYRYSFVSILFDNSICSICSNNIYIYGVCQVFCYNWIMGRKKDKPKDKVKVVHGNGENLTIKQRRFVNAVVKTGNATEAAMMAYDTNNRVSAGAIGSKLLKKDKIQLAMSEHLENAGLTETRASEMLAEAIMSGVGRDSRNSDALRGLDMYYKLLGKYAPKKLEKAEVSIKLNGQDDKELSEKLDKQLEAIKELKDILS